jgi:hypothetical protein
MRILGAIMTALKNALVAVLSAGMYLLAWPFRMFAGFVNPQGRSAMAPPRPTLVPEAAAMTPAIARKMADAAYNDAKKPGPLDMTAGRSLFITACDAARYCSRHSTGETTWPMPAVPMTIKAWLLNLTPAEMKKAVVAGPERLVQHFSGRAPIEGLLPVVVKKAAKDSTGEPPVSRQRPQDDDGYRPRRLAPRRARPSEEPRPLLAI